MKTTYVYIALVVIIIVGLIAVRQFSDAPSSERTTTYDAFAQCLKDAGAKFYGAFWCPHCKEQKDLFENSLKVPYIECSTPDGKGVNQICVDEGVTGYPYWKFSDGSVLESVQKLSTLAEKTSCTLP
jgi:thiol-disulfide isomerase/thioredoxin